MSFADLPLFDALKTRMRWLEARQDVLAQNVAGADTPGFVGHDLKGLDFGELVAGGSRFGALQPVATSPMHISAAGEPAGFDTPSHRDFETTPDGNAVTVEDEMMKVAETQQDYQLATMLYSRSLGLLKLAVK